jgi:homocitrate synthase NifV/benzylmalate synthase
MGLRVGLAGEGSAASDADLGFIVEYINACGDMIDYFIYCDTDGRADPADTFGRIAFIRKKTSKPIFMHCHNDKNNAVENTIQGILAGAEGISSTFTGIGDRAGNAPIEEVLYQLREKYGIVVDGIDYDKIPALTKMVGAYAGRGPAQPGEDLAKVHEAGIHIDALLKATKKGINVYGTEPGLARVVAGISSGMATMELIYHMYSLEFDSTEASEVLREIKQEAYKKKTSFGPLEVWDYIISRRVKRNLTVEEQHLPTDPFEAFEKTYVAQNGFDRPLTL